MKQRILLAIMILLMCAVTLAGCGAKEEVPQFTRPADIRPLPSNNPGSSLISYDPDRQIYITGENIYMDYYIGVTNLPNFVVDIYSKEYINLADISVELPEGIPFLVEIFQHDEVQRKTEYMQTTGEATSALPYYVYYIYKCGNPVGIDINTVLEDCFKELSSEDLPEFYVYSISVAFVNVQELEAPVTLDKLDITIGNQTYEAKLGRVRLFSKEDFPTEATTVRRRGGYLGQKFELFNDGLLQIDAFTMENIAEDITITGLRMLEEESEILDITLSVTSGKNTIETKWDGKTPVYLYKGDKVYISVVVKNELTQKLLNQVHLQSIVEYTLDESGETVCDVTTHQGGAGRNYHEYYAIIFDGVDMEPYYRGYFYQKYNLWMDSYRGK